MEIGELVSIGNGEHKITLPSWLVGAICGLSIALLTNVGASFYWAGKITAQQESTSLQVSQLRDDMQKLRAQIEDLSKRSTKD